ncbi:hypothetical protein CRV08_01345 [Halarcobacter ebronensis]|uniref:Lipoprotein n=1 Tax=Halarcobacter ebronensis TaxID=1462615 RepID=A0A4Q0YLQ2_9BACT|nr:hypothetical protein [Halarcobacter ebronensis]RXJ70239.1 hypothetical protein CRV08_01345 [Halarcobacter ebronensis]
MNKFHSIFLLFSLLFLTSCTNKNSLGFSYKNDFNAKSVQNTKKRDIVVNNEVKFMFFVTYLNLVDNKYNNNNIDSFIVGFQNVDKKDFDLQKSDFTITSKSKEEIDERDGKKEKIKDEKFTKENNNIFIGEKPIKITKLDKESDLVKNISLKNNWAEYYLVEFNATKSSKIVLDIKSSTFETSPINFQK